MAILRMAAQMINRKGFREMSLDDLAEQLAVSKPTLYYYVKSKNGILEGILEMAMERLGEIVSAETKADAAGSGLERLTRFFEQYAAVQTDDFGACLIMTRANIRHEQFREKYATASREVSTAVRTIIRDGIKDGSIAPCNPKYMSVAMLGAINETVYYYMHNGKESPADTVTEFLSAFQVGLLPRERATQS